LRTNVDYFSTPEGSLTLEQRVKQAAVLYDELLFEEGMYETTICSKGTFDVWTPPGELDDATLAMKPQVGSEYTITMAAGNAQPVPISFGRTADYFKAEYHTIVSQIGEVVPDWVRFGSYELNREATELVRNLSSADRRTVRKLVPEVSTFLGNKIVENLNRDLVLASILGCPVSMDQLHASALFRRQQPSEPIQPAQGFLSLEVVVPNLATLPWVELIKVRKDASVAELRRVPVEIEKLARQAVLDAAHPAEVQAAIQSLMLDEILRETKRLLPTNYGLAGNIAMDIMAGLLPPPVGPLIAVMEDVDYHLNSRSWVGLLLKLRDA